MDNKALVTESVLCLLEMVDGKCGRLRQPGMQSLGGEWAEATQETKDDGGGTRQGIFQEDDKGESKK